MIMVTYAVDPVQYVNAWAEARTFSDVRPGEVNYCRRQLAYLAGLLYSNPSLSCVTDRDARKIINRQLELMSEMIEELGFIGFAKQLKTIGNAYLRSWKTVQGVLTFTYESVDLQSTSPLVSAMLLSIRTLSTDLIDWIHQWHVYLSKLPLDRSDLAAPAKLAWVAGQVWNKRKEIPTFWRIAPKLRAIMTWLIDGHEYASRLPHHGPGTTSDCGKETFNKSSDMISQYQVGSIRLDVPVDHLAIRSNTGSVAVQQFRPRNSRLSDVHKDLFSRRLITPEPANLQAAQQGIKGSLYFGIDNRLCNASRFVRFSDQGRQRRLALNGSALDVKKDLHPSTLDLSKASDDVLVDHVVNVFSGELLCDLLAVRSWDCDVDVLAGRQSYKTTVEMAMYAGMGSATTFPVQTLLFLALAIFATCEALAEESHLTDWELSDYLAADGFSSACTSREKRALTTIGCYGDDIIVANLATDKMMYYLGACGFQLNRDKSFFGDMAARESCGLYAIAGVDITPLRPKTPMFNPRFLVSAEVHESLRGQCNAAFLLGYRVLHRLIVNDLNTFKFYGLEQTQRTMSQDIISPSGTKSTIALPAPAILFEKVDLLHLKYAPTLGVLSTRGSTNSSLTFKSDVGSGDTWIYASTGRNVEDTESEMVTTPEEYSYYLSLVSLERSKERDALRAHELEKLGLEKPLSPASKTTIIDLYLGLGHREKRPTGHKLTMAAAFLDFTQGHGGGTWIWSPGW